MFVISNEIKGWKILESLTENSSKYVDKSSTFMTKAKHLLNVFGWAKRRRNKSHWALENWQTTYWVNLKLIMKILTLVDLWVRDLKTSAWAFRNQQHFPTLCRLNIELNNKMTENKPDQWRGKIRQKSLGTNLRWVRRHRETLGPAGRSLRGDFLSLRQAGHLQQSTSFLPLPLFQPVVAFFSCCFCSCEDNTTGFQMHRHFSGLILWAAAGLIECVHYICF